MCSPGKLVKFSKMLRLTDGGEANREPCHCRGTVRLGQGALIAQKGFKSRVFIRHLHSTIVPNFTDSVKRMTCGCDLGALQCRLATIARAKSQ